MGQFFLSDWWVKNDSAVKYKILSLQEEAQKRRMVIKKQFTPFSDWKIFPS